MKRLSANEVHWVRKWLQKADEDFATAELLAGRPDLYENTAFHCQQAVEKYLKGRLRITGVEPPRIHDLRRLLDLLIGVEEFSLAEYDQAQDLTPFGAQFRYPHDEDIETPVADLLATARHFRNRLRPAIEAALR